MAFPPALLGEGTNALSLLSDAIDFLTTLSNLDSLPEALTSNTVTLLVEASTCEAPAGPVLQTVEDGVLTQHARSPRLDAHHHNSQHHPSLAFCAQSGPWGGGGERIRHSRSPSVIEEIEGQPEGTGDYLENRTSPSKIVPGVKALAVKPGNFSSRSL